MKETRNILKAFAQAQKEGKKTALATVVRVEGSSYRRPGARMLVVEDGQLTGGISGGCLEGDALRRAQKAIFQNKPSVITYDTTQDDGHQVGVGLGCNGIVDVLITPLFDNTDDPIRLLSLISETRVPRVLISVTGCEQGSELLGKIILYENEEQLASSFPLKNISGMILKDIKQALENQSSETITYDCSKGLITVFIEVIIPPIHLVIYGSNYDIHPVAAICKELGWNVTVVTNVAKANKLLLQTAHVIDNKSDLLPVIDRYTAVILMTHDYKSDLIILQKILQTNASYIGLLGPKKRRDKILDEMLNESIQLSESIERIYAPCGLDIGANNPEEIALSIVAEIKAHFAGRKGTSLKYRQGTIYERAVK